MNNDAILSAAQAVVRRVSDPNIDVFATTYPKLHEMCLNAAADASKASVVLSVLPMMLDQLNMINVHGVTPDEASKVVYDHLNSRYVDHLVPKDTAAAPET